MSKYPQYMIAENPMIEDTRVFILQTRPFIMMAEVHHYEPDEWLEGAERHGDIPSIEYGLERIWIEVVFDELERADATTENLMKQARAIRKLGDWYYAYLKWEDEQSHEF